MENNHGEDEGLIFFFFNTEKGLRGCPALICDAHACDGAANGQSLH